MDEVGISKQMSYWLRHDPEDLEMDERGFVDIEDLVEKLSERFDVDRDSLVEMIEESKRYTIDGDGVRAAYGHSIDIDLDLPEDEEADELFRGTTSKVAYKILINGLQCRDRNMVHLSSTEDQAREIGKRRTEDPTVLRIDAGKAREEGIKFYKATDNIYLSGEIPAKFIEKTDDF